MRIYKSREKQLVLVNYVSGSSVPVLPSAALLESWQALSCSSTRAGSNMAPVSSLGFKVWQILFCARRIPELSCRKSNCPEGKISGEVRGRGREITWGGGGYPVHSAFHLRPSLQLTPDQIQHRQDQQPLPAQATD